MFCSFNLVGFFLLLLSLDFGLSGSLLLALLDPHTLSGLFFDPASGQGLDLFIFMSLLMNLQMRSLRKGPPTLVAEEGLACVQALVSMQRPLPPESLIVVGEGPFRHWAELKISPFYLETDLIILCPNSTIFDIAALWRCSSPYSSRPLALTQDIRCWLL